jgi:hypothetical protein
MLENLKDLEKRSRFAVRLFLDLAIGMQQVHHEDFVHLGNLDYAFTHEQWKGQYKDYPGLIDLYLCRGTPKNNHEYDGWTFYAVHFEGNSKALYFTALDDSDKEGIPLDINIHGWRHLNEGGLWHIAAHQMTATATTLIAKHLQEAYDSK